MRRREHIMRFLISFVLSLCMVFTMSGVIPPDIVSAKGSMAEGQSVNTILVYGKNTDGRNVLLAHLDVADLVDYLNENIDSDIGKIHNYSVLDNKARYIHSSGICGWSADPSARISGCVNKADIAIEYKISSLGGIVSEGSKAVIENCVNYGNISVPSGRIGGITGKGGYIYSCRNYGNICADATLASKPGDAYIGGISGGGKRCTDCVNYGKVTSINGVVGSSAGGIIGIVDIQAEVAGCLNLGEVSVYNARDANYAAGITYIMKDSSTSDSVVCITDSCVNMGKVSAGGGEANYTANIVNILNCKVILRNCLDVSGTNTINLIYGSRYLKDPEVSNIMYRKDGELVTELIDIDEEVIRDCTAASIEEMRTEKAAESLGEKFAAAPGSYPLLKAFICTTDISIPEGAALTVRDIYGNEILGDGAGSYTLYEGGTYTYEVSKSGYVTKKETFRPEQDGKISVKLEKTGWRDINSITPSNAAADAAKVSSSIAKVSGISTAADTKKKTMTITFKKVSGAKNYRIAYRKAGSKKWTYVWTAGKNKYVMKKMESGGLYDFKISAYSHSNGYR